MKPAPLVDCSPVLAHEGGRWWFTAPVCPPASAARPVIAVTERTGRPLPPDS